MKKVLFFVFAVLICAFMTVHIFAEEAIPEVENVHTISETDEKSLAEQALDWISENVEKVVLIFASIYAVFPKVGLLPILISALKKLKNYFDDRNNPNSVYNILSANATTISRFMTDFAPLIEDMKSGNANVFETLEKVKEERERANAVISACQSSIRLMAKELNDLISASTTLSAKTKAQIEQEWMEKDAEISALLNGGEDGAE